MNPRGTYLPSNDTLECSKAEIQSLCLKLLLHCAQSLKRDHIDTIILILLQDTLSSLYLP